MSSTNKFTLKWGIVSTGLIANDFCVAIQVLNSPYQQLTAVAARNAADASSFAQKFSIPNHYDSYDKLFQNNEVNIVYIGSVNHTHKELCLKAIAAGKHVLCEKPMCLTSKDQDEVLNAAKEKKVFFMEV
jgi:dihydrodiol dehydrogenase / D-xylose 1-dehydrogenase (NADP)